MKRIVWICIFALAMPIAALADSISFTDSGMLNNAGTLTGGATATYTGSISTSYTLNVPLVQFVDNNVVTATGGTVSLSTGAITEVDSTHFTFTGTLTITSSSSAVLFTSSVTDGTITKQPNGSYSINGLLANGGVNNIVGAKIVGGSLSGNRLVTGSGSAVTGTSVVPEPGTLGLLGTGLVGIAGLIRRKSRIS